MNTTPTSCINVTHVDVGKLSAGRIVVVIILSLVAVLTVAGNGILFLAIVASKRLRNRPNVLVISRAIADFGVGGVAMPLSIYKQLNYERWYLGPEMCMLFYSSFIMLCSASILHLLIIAVHRYIVICHPAYHKRMQSWNLFIMLTSCWVIPALISFLPVMNHWHLIGLEDILPCFPLKHMHSCTMTFNTAYAFIAAFVTYYIPGVVMVFCHIKLQTTTKMRVDHFRRFSIISTEINDVNMAHTLSVLMICFGLCWTVFFVCVPIEPLIGNRIPPDVWSVLVWIGCSNSMLNPFVYYMSSGTFRYNIHDFLLCEMCFDQDDGGRMPVADDVDDDHPDSPKPATRIEPREATISPMEMAPMEEEVERRRTVKIAPDTT